MQRRFESLTKGAWVAAMLRRAVQVGHSAHRSVMRSSPAWGRAVPAAGAQGPRTFLQQDAYDPAADSARCASKYACSDSSRNPCTASPMRMMSVTRKLMSALSKFS